MRRQERGPGRGRNWMSAIGILFFVAAGIIAIRNLVLYSIEAASGTIESGTQVFFDNFVNGELTNEKFVLVMFAIGGFLLYWGFFKEDYGPPDEHDWRRFNR